MKTSASAHQQPFLVPPDVDALLPGHFRGGTAKRDKRIGKTRAIHVQRQAIFLADCGDCRDVGQFINCAALGRLRDRNAHRLARMDVAFGKAVHRRLQIGNIDAACRPVDGLDPCSAREKSWCAGLIRNHVRFAVGKGDAARAGDAGLCQGIGRCSGPDKEDGDVALENCAECLLDGAVEIARAIGRGETAGMSGQIFGNFRMGSGPIIGCEKHETTSDVKLTPPRLRFSPRAGKQKMMSFPQGIFGVRGGTICFSWLI
jgi:hypothetical protein